MALLFSARYPYLVLQAFGQKLAISAMIGENLKLEKALITETNLQQNQTDRDYQLWQVSKTFRLQEKPQNIVAIHCPSSAQNRRF